MKSLELNKKIAAFLLAGIAILVVSNIVDIIYQPKKLKEYGYVVEIPDAGSNANSTQKKSFDINNIDIPALLASANMENGKMIAKKCVACHTLTKDGHNKVGPNLWNIVGSKKAHVGDKFNYSKALLAKGGEWDYKSLFEFLHKPQAYIKGSKMTFAGISKSDQLSDLILYLHSLSDNPATLPKIQNKIDK